MARRRRTRSDRDEPRRRFLFLLGAGGVGVLGSGAAIRSTGAFSAITGARRSAVDVASDDSALVGIVGLGPVKRNQRDSMVDVTNNWVDVASFTVSLDTCSDGTLYDNAGGSGCSVSLSVASGGSWTVDIDAAVTGTVPYSITGSAPGFTFSTTGSVQAESGNVQSAVLIQAPSSDNEFTAVPPQGNSGNVFEVQKVDVRDDDGDDDLVEVKYEVFEGGLNGTKVAEKTVSFAPTGQYAPGGPPPDETIQPDAGYSIQSGQLYTLRVTGTDQDGNFDRVSVQDTP